MGRVLSRDLRDRVVAALDVSSARRRRILGLRREEVSDRAGISCEWYVKLEQGREVSASSETIAALAKALILDDAEAAHLRRLAARDVLRSRNGAGDH
jgi:transcriptional regulator with XRE-family HTH domain